MERYIRRGMEGFAREALTFSPVVHVTGARQVGKSTLTRHLGLERAVYVTLDDPAALSLAEEDPTTFVQQGGDATLIIDEIQRLPELTLPLKAEVDRNRRPGRFIITGSSDFARGVGRKDSLAGRIIDLHLNPLSQQEICETVSDGAFVDRLDELVELPVRSVPTEQVDRAGLVDKVLKGGYPVALELQDRMRRAWFESYVSHVTVIEETLSRESAQPGRLQSLLRLLAAHQAGELVPAKLAREAEIPASTVRSYLDTLSRLFLSSQVKAWKSNLTSREISKPKSWVTDSGLASWLAGQTRDMLMNPLVQSHLGHLVEGFVLQELSAQQGWAENQHQLLHWRDSTGMEADVVIEFADNSIAALEIKSGATVKAGQVRHLRALSEKLGPRFRGGFVLAPIPYVQPLGDKLCALPMSFLWRG
ncbi:ATP-binding protein [Corynebacterium sp. HMSC074E01]|uniref:ATP-binding protein n=1 Tax=Corynebacterium sp. HMSC074E01 TaxID=1715017 RepID=UPI0008A3D686|nr:ATP-binding protein [Corynebacterium sp. HMSC074E01]